MKNAISKNHDFALLVGYFVKPVRRRDVDVIAARGLQCPQGSEFQLPLDLWNVGYDLLIGRLTSHFSFVYPFSVSRREHRASPLL